MEVWGRTGEEKGGGEVYCQKVVSNQPQTSDGDEGDGRDEREGGGEEKVGWRGEKKEGGEGDCG